MFYGGTNAKGIIFGNWKDRWRVLPCSYSNCMFYVMSFSYDNVPDAEQVNVTEAVFVPALGE